MDIKTNFFKTVIDLEKSGTEKLMNKILTIASHKSAERYQQIIADAGYYGPSASDILMKAKTEVDDTIERSLVLIYRDMGGGIIFRVLDIDFDGPMWSMTCNAAGCKPQPGVAFVFFADPNPFDKCAILFYDEDDWKSVVEKAL